MGWGYEVSEAGIGTVRRNGSCEVAVRYHGELAIDHYTGGKKMYICKSIWVASFVGLEKTKHAPETVYWGVLTIITPQYMFQPLPGNENPMRSIKVLNPELSSRCNAT